MKNQRFFRLSRLLGLMALALLFTRCEAGVTGTENQANAGTGACMRDSAAVCACISAQYPHESLSDTEIAALLYMREEEKLARDVYTALGERWQAPIFGNIADSEERHTEAVRCLLTKYALADPAAGKLAGEFFNPELQALYTALTAQGQTSLNDALAVGATIEDLDLSDLDTRRAAVDNADILAVFDNLAKGSRNHLRAFTGQLATAGITYVPVYIRAEVYQQIVTSPKEKGGGLCEGSCGDAAGCRNIGKDRMALWKDAFMATLPADEPSPAEAFDAAALTHEVVEQLPLPYREVLVLRYFEQLSYEDISDILELPEGTVATRLNRAKRAFARAAAHTALNPQNQ